MHIEGLPLNTVIAFSLLPVAVLVGLFQYLNSFTRKGHFRTWTSGWLFYGLFLMLSLIPRDAINPWFLAMSKNWSIATAALLMLWGSFQFINVPARQRLIAMMIVFNVVWSYSTVEQFPDEAWSNFPAFSFLAMASGFTGFCFFSRRNRHAHRGAALLTFSFALWALFLLCSGFLSNSGSMTLTGYIGSCVLQLFIAVSMTVLVLEETRGKLQEAVQKFAQEATRSNELKAAVELTNSNYQLLFQNSNDPVIIVADRNLEILDLNNAAQKLLRLKRACPGATLTSYCSLPNRKETDSNALRAALSGNPELNLILEDATRIRVEVRSGRIRHLGESAHQIIFREVAERAHHPRQLRDPSTLAGSCFILELPAPVPAERSTVDAPDFHSRNRG
jgi:PAS domain-containing protein